MKYCFVRKLITIFLAVSISTAMALDTDNTAMQALRNFLGIYFEVTTQISNLSNITQDQIINKVNASDFSNITTTLSNADIFFTGTTYSSEIKAFQDAITTAQTTAQTLAQVDAVYNSVISITPAQMADPNFDINTIQNNINTLNASTKYTGNTQIAAQVALINKAKDLQALRESLKNATSISALTTILTTQSYIDASKTFRTAK